MRCADRTVLSRGSPAVGRMGVGWAWVCVVEDAGRAGSHVTAISGQELPTR